MVTQVQLVRACLPFLRCIVFVHKLMDLFMLIPISVAIVWTGSDVLAEESGPTIHTTIHHFRRHFIRRVRYSAGSLGESPRAPVMVGRVG